MSKKVNLGFDELLYYVSRRKGAFEPVRAAKRRGVASRAGAETGV